MIIYGGHPVDTGTVADGMWYDHGGPRGAVTYMKIILHNCFPPESRNRQKVIICFVLTEIKLEIFLSR